MNKLRFGVAALCAVFVLVSTASAQDSQTVQRTNAARPQASGLTAKSDRTPETGAADSATDIELLRRRVEEVENQNRALVLMVTELKARLDAPTRVEAKKDASEAGAGSATKSAAVSETSSPRVAQEPSKPDQPDKNQPVRWSDLLGEGNRIKFYGFLRVDLDIDSQRASNTQAPLFITSPDSVAGGASIGEFSMHPRLTRFGIDFSGPRIETLGDAKLSGKLETDFENGGSESRQIIRIRHAFLRLDWNDFSILGGQTWDTVSPLLPTVNNDTAQWNAGNVGDRRPQIRAAYEPKAGRGKFSFIGGVGLTGAIDAIDLDNNGLRDGEESHLPDFQARVGYSYPIGKDRSASFGLSGFYGFLKTVRPIAGRTEFHSQLLNVDFSIPFASHFALRGEGWWGRNMSDVRGGAGQGVNVATGREIRGRGGWSEANITVSRYLSLNPGFSTDDPVDGDLPNGGRTRNRAFYFANRITPSRNLLIGVDYLRWLTTFKGLKSGVDNRVNIFLQYSF